MEYLQLLSLLLQTLNQVSRNPIFGETGDTLKQFLELGSTLAQRGEAAAEDLKALIAEIQTMVSEGRSPTVEELQSWRDRSDAAHESIQAYEG